MIWWKWSLKIGFLAKTLSWPGSFLGSACFDILLALTDAGPGDPSSSTGAFFFLILSLGCITSVTQLRVFTNIGSDILSVLGFLKLISLPLLSVMRSRKSFACAPNFCFISSFSWAYYCLLASLRSLTLNGTVSSGYSPSFFLKRVIAYSWSFCHIEYSLNSIASISNGYSYLGSTVWGFLWTAGLSILTELFLESFGESVPLTVSERTASLDFEPYDLSPFLLALLLFLLGVFLPLEVTSS